LEATGGPQVVAQALAVAAHRVRAALAVARCRGDRVEQMCLSPSHVTMGQPFWARWIARLIVDVWDPSAMHAALTGTRWKAETAV
jgi:hypothetical protein